jgi:hypothetical protein
MSDLRGGRRRMHGDPLKIPSPATLKVSAARGEPNLNEGLTPYGRVGQETTPNPEGPGWTPYGRVGQETIPNPKGPGRTPYQPSGREAITSYQASQNMDPPQRQKLRVHGASSLPLPF